MTEKRIQENTEYRVVTTNSEFEGRRVVQYGIEVRMLRDGVTESVEILDIFCNIEPVYDLLDLMKRNSVTPLTVREVVDDYLANF